MLRKTAVLVCLATGLISVSGFGQTAGPQRSSQARGFARAGYLGVGVVDLTDDRVKALKLKDSNGVEVKRVDPNSPADRAGFREDDVILEVNGKSFEDHEQFQAIIGEMRPGTKVNLTVWRDGGRQTLSATLAARPESFFAFGGPELPNAPMPPMPPFPQPYAFPPFPSNAPLVGFEGEPLSGQLAQYFGVKQGVLVREVNAGTPAERAGLKAGDVVVKVNGTPVTNPREISGLVRTSNKRPVAFTVVRNKKEITVNVDVGEERPSPSEREVL